MLAAALSIAVAHQDPWPVTYAEATNFAETSHYQHVITFLDGLQLVTSARVSYVGSTEGGRKIPVVIASNPQISTPLEAKRTGKPVIYIQANIHGGEVEGKEAALMILRDLYRTDSDLLKKLIFVVVPIYNIDGNERWGDGRVNRRSQTGPDIIGERTNDAGLDLNRDCMKVESPEMRTVLEHVYNAWDPDVVFDLHTTNGTRHGYDLTFSPSLHPNTHPLVRKYTQDELLPRVRRKLGLKGVEIFPYGNTGPRDGVTAWSTFSHEGRYVTNYAGLRNRIAILSETTSYSTFQERVQSTYRFVMACLTEIAADADRVVEMSRQADADMVSWARSNKEFGVRFEFASRGEEDVLLEKAPAEGEARRTGPVRAVERAKMQIFDRFVATRTSWLPDAYIVPASERAVVELLLLHGAVVERLREDFICDATAFRVTEVGQGNRVGGRRLAKLEGTFRTSGMNVPAGSFLVRSGQPLGMVIFYLLEPESLDGVAAWEKLSQTPVVARAYPILKVRDASRAVGEIVTEIGG